MVTWSHYKALKSPLPSKSCWNYLEKRGKRLRLGFTLVEIMRTKAFWVVFTTLCRECRYWPRSLSSSSSRSALGRNALVSLRVEHQSHTTSFLHFLLQSERALHEVHKKFLRSDCKCFRCRGVFYRGSVVAFIRFFWTGIWEGDIVSCCLYRWKGRTFYCERK